MPYASYCNTKIIIEARDNCRQIALSWAAYFRQTTTSKLLLENQADIETRVKDRQTSLTRAAAREDEGTVKILLQEGADGMTQDSA